MTQFDVSNRAANLASANGVRWLSALVVAELLATVGYFVLSSAEPTNARYVLYPFVWINVGLWAVARTEPIDAASRYRWAAVGVASAYFLVLAAVAGLIGVSFASHSPVDGFQFAMASPGWGPRIAYVTPAFHVNFVPYRVIGYLSLAYLVYATVLDAANAAVSGVLGLASCLGCSFPVVASLTAGVAGGSSALATVVPALSVDLSTAVFVVTVALLYWRPGFGR